MNTKDEVKNKVYRKYNKKETGKTIDGNIDSSDFNVNTKPEDRTGEFTSKRIVNENIRSELNYNDISSTTEVD